MERINQCSATDFESSQVACEGTLHASGLMRHAYILALVQDLRHGASYQDTVFKQLALAKPLHSVVMADS